MATRDQPGNGWAAVLRHRPTRMAEGRPEGGYTDVFEIICCDCGDHPDLDYSKVSPELHRGALVGIPGASYLAALHNLVTGKSSTATQVVAVVIFVIIDFLLILIPFAFLELRPEATKARLKHTQDWLMSHALQLMAAIALLLGAYLAISGLVRLS
jgi:Sap, sulfolipid-1-addressing protein